MLIEKRSGRRLMNQINVVPYIDVMLVLLVIFMVTAPLINPGQIELPSVGKTSSAAGGAAWKFRCARTGHCGCATATRARRSAR